MTPPFFGTEDHRPPIFFRSFSLFFGCSSLGEKHKLVHVQSQPRYRAKSGRGLRIQNDKKTLKSSDASPSSIIHSFQNIMVKPYHGITYLKPPPRRIFFRSHGGVLSQRVFKLSYFSRNAEKSAKKISGAARPTYFTKKKGQKKILPPLTGVVFKSNFSEKSRSHGGGFLSQGVFN